MKVILLEDIKGSGKKGDVKDVSDGYARNYLFPKKLARQVTASVLNEIEGRKSAEEHKKKTEAEQAEQQKRLIDGEFFIIKAKSGAGGRLFGSVTTKEIAASIFRKTGCEIDRRRIVLDTDIKQYGSYDVTVKIHSGVNAAITIVVEE